MMALFPLVAVIAATGQRAETSNPIVGTYVSWIFLDGKPLCSDGSQGTIDRITLKPDHTFILKLEVKIMQSLSRTVVGTYNVSQKTLTLTYTKASFSVDGKDQGQTGLMSRKFQIKDGMLSFASPIGGEGFYRKVGSGPPPLPDALKIRPRSVSAEATLRKVENAYASLKSFRATGVLKSHGAGYVATSAAFSFFLPGTQQIPT